MSPKLLTLVLAIGLVSAPAQGQDAKAVLDAASKTMGAAGLKSIRFSGSGSAYTVGQSPNPKAPWPKSNVKSFDRVVNYETASSRTEIVSTPPAPPGGGGAGQPAKVPEQRQVQVVSGNHAWNVAGNNNVPVPAALDERQLQIWIGPHGVLKAAAANKATAKSTKKDGSKLTVLSFQTGSQFKVNGYINGQNLVEKVETWIPNPVLGDMLVETTYSDYKDFGGIKFPTRVVQKQGGHPALELNVTDVQPNAPADISAPENVRAASAPAVKVESQKLAEGVWYLTGGSHHSVVVEFKDHVAVIEGPQNEERSLVVIGQVKMLVPGKPIRYLVNTHHHFDHSGGIRTYAAEGATILTHQINKPYYEQVFKAPRTLRPDALSRAGKKAKIEGIAAKHVLTDGARTVELHHIQGNAHNDGIIMAYFPQEKVLVEVDVFTPPAPNAPPPATPNPFSVNLYENIERLKLAVERIAPLHGRLVTLADLKKAIGKS